MRSPLESRSRLEHMQFAGGLTAYQCPETKGLWIRARDYYRWATANGPDRPAAEHLPFDIPVPSPQDDMMPKLCPETGTIMVRYRVAAGQTFHVDRSVTGGIWLDRGEWSILEVLGLEASLGAIFGAPWQSALRTISARKVYEDRLEQECGPQVLALVKQLDAAIQSDTARGMAIALLGNHAPEGSAST